MHGSDILDSESWLEGRPYSQARKEQLIASIKSIDGLAGIADLAALEKVIVDMLNMIEKVKMHTKEENYTDYKHARAINSRTDEFKVLTGPAFSAMEKILFALPWFIKKVPVKDRPRFIRRLMKPGFEYWATDYTAFESLFTPEIMRAVEFQLYEHLIGGCAPQLLAYIKKTLAGRNTVESKNTSFKVDGVRMSGEMNTSLGNSFSNLMFFLFYMEEMSIDHGGGHVEGDDGLFAVPCGTPVPTKFFETIGLKLKIEVFSDVSHASFCGIVADTGSDINVTDPKKAMAAFGWGGAQYVGCRDSTKKKLVRCKAFSLAHQFRGCPILDVLAHKTLQLTSGYNVEDFYLKINMDQHKSLVLQQAMENSADIIRDGPLEPGLGTRMLVEELYSIPVHIQIEIEHYISGLTSFGSLHCTADDGLWPHNWVHYATHYTFPVTMTNGLTTVGLVRDQVSLDEDIDIIQAASRATVRVC
jgi:hypothetical protein